MRDGRVDDREAKKMTRIEASGSLVANMSLDCSKRDKTGMHTACVTGE